MESFNKIDAYVATVQDQIRCGKIRSYVTEEIRVHLEEERSFLLEAGISEDVYKRQPILSYTRSPYFATILTSHSFCKSPGITAVMIDLSQPRCYSNNTLYCLGPKICICLKIQESASARTDGGALHVLLQGESYAHTNKKEIVWSLHHIGIPFGHRHLIRFGFSICIQRPVIRPAHQLSGSLSLIHI